MRLRAAIHVLLVSLSATSIAAQSLPSGAGSTKSKSWTLSTRVDIGAEYDGNVFLLPDNKLDNVRSPSVSEQVSGRYTLMESPSDLITTVRGFASFKTDGLDDRDLTIAPAIGYEHFQQNVERRNVSFAVAVAQDLRRDGRIRLRAGYLPTYYARNFLTDAVDADADGRISASERRYARSDYSELELELDYRRRLVKSRRARPFGAFLDVGVGFASRRHDAPFAARDFSGPTASLRLELSPRRGLEFETSYDAAFPRSPVRTQVILLDEPLFGEDLNGNGTSTDLNARSAQTVDRSRVSHLVGQSMRIRRGRTDLELSVRYRIRRFTSDEPYDVANNGRRDQRLQLGAEVRQRIMKGLRLVGGVRYGNQQLNRRTDLGAEGAVDDYTKLQAHLGLRYTP